MKKIEFLDLNNRVVCYLNEINPSFIDENLLSDSERKEYIKFGAEFRKKEWLAGRLVMKNAINSFIRKKIDLQKISPVTKYYFTHFGRLIYYSISHNKQYALAAASLDPVGIDIELEREFNEALKAKIFSEKDIASVHSLDLSKNQKLTLLWTMKEATFKAISKGTRFHLKDILIKNTGSKFVAEYNINNSTLKCDIHYINHKDNFISLATLRRV